jgi:hypothetical protein
LRTTDERCPFCGSSITDAMRDHVRIEHSARLSRAAMLALGASLALAACGESVSPHGSDARADEGRADRVIDTGIPCELDPACSSADYGAPPPPFDGGSGQRNGAPPAPHDA